ncbi:MAG: trehalose-6-phosphate synthase [Anaerolineae bacterium]|nr:trehalose-6-phosphate synthase [Anaerolineae bacterium]
MPDLPEPDLLEQQNPLIVIASNRGPFSFSYDAGSETFDIKRGAGGLVTALSALVERHDVRWIAAALGEDDIHWASANPRPTAVQGISLQLMIPDAEAYRQYYSVIANPLLWFIQHQLWDAPRTPSIMQETWQAWQAGYVQVNQQFASTIAESLPAESDRPILILPQDYHLYLVPHYLREALGDRVIIQPFVHIPWPGIDAWQILPAQMRDALLRGLLAADRVGFQTHKDAFNFVQTCRFYLEDAHSYGSRTSIVYNGHKVEAAAYPISIDVEKVLQIAQETETNLFKRQLLNFLGDNRLILRTDRIEPSKNILRGLEAFRVLLQKYPQHHGSVNMLALLVPSRMEVDEYQTYFQEIMALAGMINAEFSQELWEPVRIIVGDNYVRAIAAMQLYDVLLVNPIADGMNLVAKEGVLVNQRNGMLVLSENAGAFYELGEHALTVSPYDVYGTAEALNTALTMPSAERETRAAPLREIVRAADVRHWFSAQVNDALRASSTQAKQAATSETS